MRFLDTHQVVPVIMPVNLATAANSGDWISLAKFRRVAFIVVAAIGAAAEDIVVTVRQATTAAGGGAKDLLGIDRVWTKQGADLAAIGAFTKVSQTAAATYTSDTGGETANLYVVEIDAEQLDVTNGFDFVTLNIADTGTTAKLGCVIAILSEPRGSANVSAIA